MKLFIVCLVFINVITFFIYGSDKQRAKEQMEGFRKDIDFAGSSRRICGSLAGYGCSGIRQGSRCLCMASRSFFLCQMGLTHTFIC